MNELLEIDGSVLEGGGQILRISISLSALLGVPVRVYNIRAGRSKPGLAAQHLKGIELVANMCGAKLKGAGIGSTEIEFRPGKIRGGQYFINVQTAGSISLLLQVALPCALMADGIVTFDLRGGTNADMAPQIDYLTEVFGHALKRFGADFTLNIHRRGYFPRGGGHVTCDVTPVRALTNVTMLHRGDIKTIRGWSFVAGTLPIRMAQQMADGAKQVLGPDCRDIDIRVYKEDSRIAPDNCNGIILSCETSSGYVLGSDGLGRRGVDAAIVGKKAAETLHALISTQACVDTNTQDQIIIYMALAGGKSSVRVNEVTLHTKTAIYIAELIAKVQFNIIPEGDESIIECNGIGYINKNLAV